MKLASSAMHFILAMGIGVTFVGGCGGDTTTPDQGSSTYTWTQVSTDIKTTCAISTSCHQKGTTQSFSYDATLTAGSDMANYTALMAVTPALVSKTTPASSMLLTVAQGGMYMGMTHSSSLTTAKAANWTLWITAGAAFQ